MKRLQLTLLILLGASLVSLPSCGSNDTSTSKDTGVDADSKVDAAPNKKDSSTSNEVDADLSDAAFFDAITPLDSSFSDALIPDALITPDAALPPSAWQSGPSVVDAAWITNAPACTEHDWLRKYFTYRARLHGATGYPFVVLGTNPGESLLASHVASNANCDNHWSMSGCTLEKQAGKLGMVHYGDTTIKHGQYLAALGTEFRMFQMYGLPTSETANEIKLALQAFNRIDLAGETSLGYTGNLDGFFLRGDAPDSLITHFPNAQCIRSELSCQGTVPTVSGGYFESQDQVIQLFRGLFVVVKMLPAGTLYNGMDLRHEAQAIAHRVVMHLKAHSWKIIAPNGEQPPNAWGGNALPFSDQIAKAANIITENQFGVSDYRDSLSNTAGAALMAAVDASWFTQSYINQSLALSLVFITKTWSIDKFTERSAAFGVPEYALSYAAMHNEALPSSLSLNEIDSALDRAPCSGPCIDTNNCEAPLGWRGPNRYNIPEDRSGGVYTEPSIYNGVDYMFAHNSYAIYKQGKHLIETRPPASTCNASSAPGAWIGQTSTPTTLSSFNAQETCAEFALQKNYCGRSLASWIDAASRGEASIYIADKKWTCSAQGECTFAQHGTVGTPGADLFIGTSGNDSFDGSDGNDCLYGMGGDDMFKGGAGRDELWGGEGNDKLCGETCSILDTEGGPDILFGENGNDTMEGGPGSDEMSGGDGDDDMDGSSGDDFLWGGNENDKIRGGAGRDFLRGEDGDDEISGNAGDDRIEVGNGRNKADGGDGDDTITAGPSDDFLRGDSGNDTIWGIGGNDILCGGCGKDEVFNGTYCRDQSIGFCLSDPAGKQDGCANINVATSYCSDSAYDAW